MNNYWKEKANRYRWLYGKSQERLLTDAEKSELLEIRDMLATAIRRYDFLRTSI